MRETHSYFRNLVSTDKTKWLSKAPETFLKFDADYTLADEQKEKKKAHGQR